MGPDGAHRGMAAASFAAGLLVLASAAAPARAEPLVYGIALERSLLDHGHQDWRSARLRVANLGGDPSSWFELGDERRFGASDLVIAVGSGFRLSPETRLEFDIGGSPSCEVTACATGRLAVAQRVAKGVELHLGYRRTDHDVDVATVLDAGAEWYFGAERLAYTGFLGELDVGPSATSHLVQYDHYFGDHGSVGAFLVDGDEVARVGPDAVVAAPVRGQGVRARVPLGGFVLELGLERYEQGGFYERRAFRLGLRRAL